MGAQYKCERLTVIVLNLASRRQFWGAYIWIGHWIIRQVNWTAHVEVERVVQVVFGLDFEVP